ncbi:MAG: TonB-dependent receptor [Chlorobiales bacterium]|nr:TonB-dependent receptor [Chlorobiales bacterium]
MRFFSVLTLGFLAMSGYRANAQDTPSDSIRSYKAEPMVVTASRAPAKGSAPRSLTVITNDEIKASPIHSVQDILQYVEGVQIQRRGPLGTQADISVRGGTFEQTLVMIDGNKVSDPQTGHHNMNLPISIDDIERVEVLRGAGSRLFGPNAFGGVINIITRSGAQTEVSTDISGGEKGYVAGTASVALPVGNYAQRLSLSKSQSDGYRDNTDFAFTSVSYNSALELGSHKLNLFAGYIDKEFGANQFYSPKYPAQWEETKTTFVSLGGNLRLSESEHFLTLNPKLYWRKNEDEFLLNRNNPAFYRNLHTTNVYGGELQLSFVTGLGISAIGLEAGKEDIESSNLGNHKRERGGVFLEQQIGVTERFSVVPGASVYAYSEQNPQFLPALDASYQLTETMKLYASVGKSFRIPTYTELYYKSPTNLGNSNLKPEEAWTYEAGADWHNSFATATLSVFERKGKNIIDWSKLPSESVWQVRNVLDMNTFGLELSGSVNPELLVPALPVSQVRLSYAFLNSSKDDGDFESRYVFNYLKHQVILGVTHGWFAGISQTWKVRYEDREGLAPHTLVDTRVAWQHDWGTFKTELYVEATNLFDVKYVEIEPIPMPGRWIIVGFRPAIF